MKCPIDTHSIKSTRYPSQSSSCPQHTARAGLMMILFSPCLLPQQKSWLHKEASQLYTSFKAISPLYDLFKIKQNKKNQQLLFLWASFITVIQPCETTGLQAVKFLPHFCSIPCAAQCCFPATHRCVLRAQAHVLCSRATHSHSDHAFPVQELHSREGKAHPCDPQLCSAERGGMLPASPPHNAPIRDWSLSFGWVPPRWAPGKPCESSSKQVSSTLPLITHCISTPSIWK